MPRRSRRWSRATLRPRGSQPLPKTLRLDTANFPDIVGKTEGMALLGDGSLVIINDDDYGIAGGRTQIVVLRGTGIVRK